MTRLAALLGFVVLGLLTPAGPAYASQQPTHQSIAGTVSSGPQENYLPSEADLIFVTGPDSMEVPGPGHETRAEFTVENRTRGTLPLSLRFSSSQSPLFDIGGQLSLALSDGQEHVLSTALTDLDAQPKASVRLASLAPGETRVISGTLTLDRSASNEYQGLSGNLRISFDASTVTSQLVETGGNFGAALVAVALALAVGGAFSLTRRTSESTRS
ncbi:MAG: hypothetical protein ACTH30_04885 [Leucobacter sp.]